MRIRAVAGELGLALVFAAIGIVWVAVAIRLPLWEGFAPQSGFMPLIYGLALIGLAAVIAVTLLIATDAPPAREPVGKPLLVLAALLVAVAGLEAAGFGIAVFALLAFLFVVVERLPVLVSSLTAALTTAVLILLFRGWLSVPLPKGPLGF
jgi:Tripartite tricarboxylate transporter TctB family